MKKLKILLAAIAVAKTLMGPAEAQNGGGFTKIAAQENHSLALRADGTVVAWGSNSYVPDGLNGVVGIATGYGHSLALKADGTVVAWGRYYTGADGDPFAPASVPPGLNGVIAIASGSHHSLALKSDGTVVAWGYIHNGVTVVPATVPGGLNGVVAIAAGAGQSLALKQNGTITAWGRNDLAQTAVPAGLNGVIAIASGWGHNLALKSDGSVVAWGGRNDFGQLAVPVGLRDVIAIAAGAEHSLALKADGTVVGWGYNLFGQTTAPTGLNTAVALAAGDRHSLALKSDGTIVGWGDNSYGQMPQPFITAQPISQASAMGGSASFTVSVSGIPPLSYQWRMDGTEISGATSPEFKISSVQKDDAGTYSVTVTNSSGEVTSFDAVLIVEPILITQQPLDQTGLWAGTTAHFNVAVSGAAPLRYQWYKDGTKISGATGSAYSQPITESSDAGTYSVVISNGYGSVTSSNALVTVVPAPSWRNPPGKVVSFGECQVPEGLTNVVGIAAGGGYGLALKADGTVVAWGSDLGPVPLPAHVSSLPDGLNGVVAIAAGGFAGNGFSGGRSHRLALKADGTVVAWGDNIYGQTNVPDGLADVTAIAAAGYHSLALKADGTVVAWGMTDGGGLLNPATVPEGLNGVVAIAAGRVYNLALKFDGTVWEWENGDTSTVNRAPDGLKGVVAIAAGPLHNLALKSDGTVVAWGMMNNGSDWVPATVPEGLMGVVGISAAGNGALQNLALKSDGTVVVWGYIFDPETWTSDLVTASAGLNRVVAIAAGAFQSLALVADAPTLALKASGENISISWPLWAKNFTLQSTTNLGDPGSWTPMLGVPVIEDSRYQITDLSSEPAKFYRLSK